MTNAVPTTPAAAVHDPPTDSPRRVVGAAARLIAGLIREQPAVFAVAALGAVAFTSAIVASAVVVGWVTDALVVPVLEGGEAPGGRLRTALALILGVAVWKSLGIVIRRTAASRMQFMAQTRLRKRLIAHQLGLSLRWYGTRGVGDLLSVSDVDSRQATMVLAPLPFATGVSVLLLGSAAVITVTDPVLGLLAILLLSVVVVLDLQGAWRTFHLMERAQARRGRVASVAHESFDGALTVKALGREEVETERFGREAAALADQLIEVGRVWSAYRAVTEGLPAIGTVVVLVVGTIRIADGGLSAGELVRVTYLLSLLAVPARLIGYLMWDAAHSVAGWRRVETVLEVDDALPAGEDRTPPPSAPARVEADRVGFGYEPGLRVLHDLDLRLEPGRTLAVVGPTGSGKSTLAMLLARLWDPDAGTVRLDGRDLRSLAPGLLPSEVAYVAQDAFLFDDTVAGNVALHLDLDEGRIREALRLANALEFVEELPDGIDTDLGERGATLSGGQRQRLALARALARRPRLLILDDATSAVDPSVETSILRALRDAELPSTIVLIAYRRSSIMLADEVVFVDDGRVLAHGPHEHLLRDVPGYSALLRAYETEHPS